MIQGKKTAPLLSLLFKFVLLFLFLSTNTNIKEVCAQSRDQKLVQFSGIVVTGDSLYPLPFVNIIIKGTYRGTVSDYYGFFSFVAQTKDTVTFSAIGFKDEVFIIPDSLDENRYSLIQKMVRDTIQLRAALIYPWPSKEEFKQAFLELDIPDDDMARAKKNLDEQVLSELAETIPYDGSLNYKWAVQERSYKMYYAGQLPPNNLLNPIAWAKFIEAWKRGDFKRQD